jgi:hypothetical protein|tara:strand:- start:1836 stop:2045 length:210 start_codon:yes stop_codon:yes gene_type:complete
MAVARLSAVARSRSALAFARMMAFRTVNRIGGLKTLSIIIPSLSVQPKDHYWVFGSVKVIMQLVLPLMF